jgi:hypothetical protein
VTPVIWLNTRCAVNEPVASLNRPVPPVIVADSTIVRTPGVAVRLAWPENEAVSRSPFAAVKTYDPLAILVCGFTRCGTATA